MIVTIIVYLCMYYFRILLVDPIINHYFSIFSGVRLTGEYFVNKLISHYKLSGIVYINTENKSTNNYYISDYDEIHLSSEVGHKNSISSIAIALHEYGHMVQYNSNNNFVLIIDKLLDKLYIVPIFSSLLFFIIYVIKGTAIYWLLLSLVIVLFSEIFRLLIESQASITAHKLVRKHTDISKSNLFRFDLVLMLCFYTYLFNFPNRLLQQILIVVHPGLAIRKLL